MQNKKVKKLQIHSGYLIMAIIFFAGILLVPGEVERNYGWSKAYGKEVRIMEDNDMANIMRIGSGAIGVYFLFKAFSSKDKVND